MLMRTLQDGTACSALGFGCGAVMGRVGRKDSLAAMAAALDAGVTLFDTAPSYGHGEAEGLLGEFLQGRRDGVLISTKFGVEPAPKQGWKSALKPAARALLRVLPGARGMLRRGGGVQAAPARLEPATMMASLERSLGQLKTDHVDFFFLHDVPVQSVAQDDLQEALERLQNEGKVHRFGVSSSIEAAARSCERAAMGAVQLPVNLSNLHRAQDTVLRAREAGKTVLANNIFGGLDGARGTQQRIREIAVDSAVPAAIREKLGALGPAQVEAVLLPLVLRTCGADVAIVSMMHARNLQANVSAVANDNWNDDELALLFQCLLA